MKRVKKIAKSLHIEKTCKENSKNYTYLMKLKTKYNDCYSQPFLLFNESNLETMAKMPDCFVDLTVTSPPYDNLRTYNGYCFDFENVAKELFRVTKQGGVVVWVVGDATIKGSETGTSFKQALYFMQCGFNLHDTMIYHKNNAMPLTHNRYDPCFEYMFVFSKGKPKAFNPLMDKTLNAGQIKKRELEVKMAGIAGHQSRNRNEHTVVKSEKYRKNLWSYSVGTESDKTKHPAPFPEQLANDHIISWSNEGDIIYDPFAGSGTTGKMAILNKRKCIMSEISAEYCEIIKKRLEPIINK